MDVVITYVNGADPLWQKDYSATQTVPGITKRYRDWGTLKYLLRGIEAHMPYSRNVYLVVSRESQVPDWVDRSKLHVVLHSDFIPENHLPLFNGCAIEMFLHRIPGLDEEFVYFNDDFFPVRDVPSDYFFKDGRSAAFFRPCLFAPNHYKYHCLLSDRLAREASGKAPRHLFFVRPQHTAIGLFQSVAADIYSRYEGTIRGCVTALRARESHNHYLYVDYAKYLGKTFKRRISNRHFSVATAPVERVCSFLMHPDRDFACINDVQMPESKYETYNKRLLETFEQTLPLKSRFEL